MANTEKTAKLSFSTILPAAAVALAALSLVFTFLIGVNVYGEATQTHYIYRYFSSDFVNSLAQTEGALRAGIRAQVLFGILFTVIGLVTVLVFAGLTCYRAVKKYAFKQDCGVEKFAVCTYLAYVIFAAVIYSLNAYTVSAEGAVTKTAYGFATIVGLSATTCLFAAWFALKAVHSFKTNSGGFTAVSFACTLVRILLLVVVIALTTLPIVTVKTEALNISGNFLSLIAAGLGSTYETKLELLVSSSVAGVLLATAVIVFHAVLIASSLFSAFGKKKNDNVFYLVGSALTAFLIFFSVLAGSFVIDALETEGSLGLVLPFVIFGLSVATFVYSLVYPQLVEWSKRRALSKAEKLNSRVNEEGESEYLLEVKDLRQHFVVGKDFFGRPNAYLKAVDGVSFKLKRGKTLGIVGESGCGKTTMDRTILRLHNVTGGEVYFKGKKISDLKNRAFDKLRPTMQLIFQDPYASLSPRLTVGEIIGEAARQHGIVSKKDFQDYVLGVMKLCGLQPHYFERYPHEFSGGQRQRICIARALALKPELVICDEPVSALDVSIQAQIINMLIELRKSLGLTYVFISHDLSVVKHISDEVGVMYLGTLVEYGSKGDIFDRTMHPYTRALFSAVPVPNPHVKMNRILLQGDIPSPVNPPKGCKFHTRCDSCMEICSRIAPVYKEVEKDHFCACHLYNTAEETAALEDAYEKALKAAEEEEQNKNKRGVRALLGNIKKLFGKKSKPVQEDTDVAEE